ncbi:MAG: HD domain-containing phosphohydrolase [Chloroflexota bacterium]
MRQGAAISQDRGIPLRIALNDMAASLVGKADGSAARTLAALNAALVLLVGAAAFSRAGAESAPTVATITFGAALGLGLSFLVTGRARLLGMAVAITSTAAFAELTFDSTPTVVWLFALVVPAIGLVHGFRIGALAGLIAAPVLHWVETGIALDLFDPQTPFGILILIVVGATPGYLLELARRRGLLLDIQLERAEGLVQRADAARRGEMEARQQAVFMLARAAEARDGTTGLHIEHVRDLAAELAVAVGVPADEIEQISWSAMLHDVGKIRVPDRVLLKPGRLDEEEWELIRQHPAWGEELLKGDEGFALARQIARWHHEDWDGRGYPDGLSGLAIPLAARIVRVVDVYDALMSERPYKPAWTLERTLDELKAMQGRGLDPALTDQFIRLRDRT